MKKLLMAGAAIAALTCFTAAARADVILGGQDWTGTGATLSLTPVVPGGNQPQNAPCIICGANQPGQPAGFGYNDYQNGGNLSSATAFSDQGAGGRNTLPDDTFNNTSTGGYQIGSGSPFLAFLLSHGDTTGGFSIGFDVNDNGTAQTLNSFFFLDLTTHTVLASFTGGATGNIPSVNNGTGFPDYTISGNGLNLNDVSVGDEIIFAARMSGLNDGPDSFFVEPAAVPGPIVGAGLPGIVGSFGLIGLNWYRRRRNVVA